MLITVSLSYANISVNAFRIRHFFSAPIVCCTVCSMFAVLLLSTSTSLSLSRSYKNRHTSAFPTDPQLTVGLVALWEWGVVCVWLHNGENDVALYALCDLLFTVITGN